MKNKRKHIIKAYLTEDEYKQIIQFCELSGLSVSTFTRNVCLGSKVSSREDAQARRELLRVNADLGRLGGLLKQAISSGASRDNVNQLLQDIEFLRLELKEKIKAI